MTENTRAAKAAPDKLVFVPGKGRVRRIWCPPFVKGPEDRPLIPKVRVFHQEDKPEAPTPTNVQEAAG